MSINYLILKSVPCFLLSKHILIQKMIAAIASSYWNESSEKKLETPEHENSYKALLCVSNQLFVLLSLTASL